MMNSSSLDRRKRLAEKAIEETVKKGETIGGRNGRLKVLRDVLRRAAEEYEHPESHFDIISDVELLELYANVVEPARDHNATDQALALSSPTLQGTESVGGESKGQGFVLPPAPMPPTNESGHNEGSEAGESEKGEEGEKLPSYEEDVGNLRMYYSHPS
jgi:hypothetical protein